VGQCANCAVEKAKSSSSKVHVALAVSALSSVVHTPRGSTDAILNIDESANQIMAVSYEQSKKLVVLMALWSVNSDAITINHYNDVA
jgi:hypothetical protein